jgi:phenylpropionate dioxygenase-like ring-hydroxylating dioxygenase large terminal subunit
VQEAAGAVFLFNATEPHLEAAAAALPEQLTSPEYSSFLCYTEWKGDYRYVLDNVIDPMHGAFLHKQSHSMAEGDISAEFQLRDRHRLRVREEGPARRQLRLDRVDADTGIHWMRLEIPYPKTGGPGGNFTIIGSYTPISNRTASRRLPLALPQGGWLAARHLALPVPQPAGSSATGTCWSRTA